MQNTCNNNLASICPVTYALTWGSTSLANRVMFAFVDWWLPDTSRKQGCPADAGPCDEFIRHETLRRAGCAVTSHAAPARTTPSVDW